MRELARTSSVSQSQPFAMKGLIVFLALAVVLGTVLFSDVAAEHVAGLRTTFGIGLSWWKGENFFFDIPRNKSTAFNEGWQLAERSAGDVHRKSLVLLCPPHPPNLCGYFDDETGFIGGLQICISLKDFSNALYSWKTLGFRKWTHPSRDEEYQCTSLYIVSDEYLHKTLDERLASYSPGKTLQENKIWLTGTYGKLDEVSTKESDLSDTVWTKQQCIPLMGQHWYYKMNATTVCSADDLYRWFCLTDQKVLVAIGLMVFGTQAKKTNERDWFEHPTKSQVELIVPHRPKCLSEIAENPGVLTMHTYFVEKPWNIGCPVF